MIPKSSKIISLRPYISKTILFDSVLCPPGHWGSHSTHQFCWASGILPPGFGQRLSSHSFGQRSSALWKVRPCSLFLLWKLKRCSHSSGDWKSKVKVPAGLISPEASPGLQMVPPSVSSRGLFLARVSLVSLSLLIKTPLLLIYNSPT